jgi:hypothetical protein
MRFAPAGRKIASRANGLPLFLKDELPWALLQENCQQASQLIPGVKVDAATDGSIKMTI